MGWIKDSSGLKIFESDDLKHNYVVDDKFWEIMLLELSVDPAGGQTKSGKFWDGGKQVKFPPYRFAESFEALYASGDADDEIQRIDS